MKLFKKLKKWTSEIFKRLAYLLLRPCELQLNPIFDNRTYATVFDMNQCCQAFCKPVRHHVQLFRGFAVFQLSSQIAGIILFKLFEATIFPLKLWSVIIVLTKMRLFHFVVLNMSKRNSPREFTCWHTAYISQYYPFEQNVFDFVTVVHGSKSNTWLS